MNIDLNIEYKEIPQSELIRLEGGVFFPTGNIGNILIKIISVLFPNEII